MNFVIKPDDRFYFDEQAAERPLRFIARYLQINEDKYHGPMTLLPWQVEIARNLFGWRWRKDNTRRFKSLFLFIAKGSGKTPFLAALALYAFLADLDPRTGSIRQGVNVCSVASNYKQANISFEAATKFLRGSEKLADKTERLTYTIRNHVNDGKWSIFSGTPKGKHGYQYNVCLCDELHEWDRQGKQAFEHVRSNLRKRDDSLLLMATNCGEGKDSLCYELYQYSKQVEANPEYDLTWYPVLYEAPAGCRYDDPKAWRAANPSLDVLITSDALAEAANQVKGDKYREAHFRRFALSQWPDRASATAWLSMDDVDQCIKTEAERDKLLSAEGESLETLPLWVGLDLSLTDDLSSVSYLWVGAKRIYAGVDIWVTRRAANEYEDMGIPYQRWADEGAVTIIDQPTFDSAAKTDIYDRIRERVEGCELQGVLYDPAHAGDLVIKLEQAGYTCIPQSQGIVALNAPTKEFERRTIEHSIVLPQNGCLRWQAENAHITSDNNGLIRLSKPGRSGKYAGQRSIKIDSLAALVFSMARLPYLQRPTEADDKAALLEKRKQWSGELLVL